jgi:hypothetical protein
VRLLAATGTASVAVLPLDARKALYPEPSIASPHLIASVTTTQKRARCVCGWLGHDRIVRPST